MVAASRWADRQARGHRVDSRRHGPGRPGPGHRQRQQPLLHAGSALGTQPEKAESSQGSGQGSRQELELQRRGRAVSQVRRAIRQGH